MLTFQDILRLRDFCKKNNSKLIFIFNNYPYRLIIDRYIHAADAEDVKISWASAFSSRRPEDVLNTLKLKKILLISKDKEKVIKSINELFRNIP